MICLVQKRDDTCKHPNTVQCVFLWSDVRMWKGTVVPELEQSRGETKEQCFDIRQGIITSSADVDRREEGEDIFGRFWQFPELRPSAVIP